MTEPKTREWPLILFTVGLQLAAGMACIIAAHSMRISYTSSHLLGLSLFPVLACAAFASIFHVGRPLSAWRAFSNLRSSRLTVELLIFVVFGGLSLTTSASWAIKGSSPTWLSVATACFGVLAVFTSGRIYLLPAQPLWNAPWTMASFFASALLLGGVAERALSPTDDPAIFATVLVVAGAASWSLSVGGMLQRISRTTADRYTAPESYPTLRSSHWLQAVGGILLGCLVPLAFVLGPRSTSFLLAIAVLVATLVGVSAGRALMYSRGVALSRF